MTVWLAIIVLAIGAILVFTGKTVRLSQGLSAGRSLDLDDRTLFSPRLGLVGRPDRIVEEDGIAIPEEWKSSRRVYDSHRAQIGVYLLLLENETGVRPPHGYVVTGDGHREKVENTPELRARVLEAAGRIREARRRLAEIIRVDPPPSKCRNCGMRQRYGQRKA